MSDSFNLTRDDLKHIAGGNLRVIRALEKLFSYVPSETNNNTELAETGISKSNQAISEGIRNERKNRGSRVLTWLSM